jgi:hypothetical protein
MKNLIRFGLDYIRYEGDRTAWVHVSLLVGSSSPGLAQLQLLLGLKDIQ